MPHTHPVIDNDLHFVINPISREILNNSNKIKLMQGDHASEVFTFEIPRYIDGHDMSLCNKIAIHYINEWVENSGELYIDMCSCLTENGDGVTRNDSLFFDDKTHPTADGHELIFKSMQLCVPELFV